MIEWYSSDEFTIHFSCIPKVGIRYALPSFTESELKSIKRYPFINKQELTVRITRGLKVYEFIIPKGYCYDGASIPRLFWRVIGSNTDNSFLIAALVHDVLCEHHEYIDYDRKFSTEVFNALLEVSDVNAFKRFCMKSSVNFYQKLFGKWSSKKNG